jgi:hypothetical protein
VSKGADISKNRAHPQHITATVYRSTYGVVSQYDIGAVKTLDNMDENTFLAAVVPPTTAHSDLRSKRDGFG